MEPDKEIRINLIEKDYKVLGRRKNMMICLFIALLMLSGMLYSYTLTRARVTALQAENGRLKNEYSKAETLIQKVEDNKTANDILEDKRNSVLQVQKRQISTLEILDEIEKTMPPGIRLIEIEISLEKVTLKGFAPAHTPEALLLSGLRNSNMFADVVIIASHVNDNSGEVLFEVEVAREVGE